MNKGKQDIEEDAESIFRVFRESILAAEAEVEERMLEKAVGTDEIGAIWYHSRKLRGDEGH